jgi:hypothetical protein
VPQEDIGRVVGVSHVTLRRYFKSELATAAVQANAKVAEVCYTMATDGKNPAATFFWLKTRAGWRETNAQEHRFVDGKGQDRKLDIDAVQAWLNSQPNHTGADDE